MLKKLIIILLLILFNLNCVTALICDNESIVRPALIKIVTDYIFNHNETNVSKEEIKDLVNFYKTNGSNCEQSGGQSLVPIYTIIQKADTITITAPICSDGTELAGCSNSKPKYCENGQLKNKCTKCGCPDDYACNTGTDACYALPVACNVNSDCGINGYIGNNFCSSNKVYRNYITFNCLNPGKTYSSCTNSTNPDMIENCTFNCTGGVCSTAPNSCSDSDGGIKYNISGTVSGYFNGSPYSSSDTCNDATNLKEYYCSGTSSVFTTYACTNGCSGGKCNAGTADSCSDTDAGQNYYLKGFASGYKNNTPYNNSDICLTSTNLKEYYCSGTSALNITYICSNCSNGACINATPDSCSDTDGGQVYNISGTVSGNSSGSPYSYSDVCNNATNLKEYYCSGASSTFTNYPCTNGCSAGKCNATPNSCSDSDGGQVYNTFGTVSGNASGSPYSYSDVCNDATNLKEYYCSGTTSIFATYACPSGCASGKCNAATPDSCADSDGGQYPSTLGTVSGNLSGSPYSNTDVCNNASNLKEYYCSGTSSVFTNYPCTYGCSAGKCNAMPANSCSDSDGGQVYNTLGTISGNASGSPYSYTDFCQNTTNVLEYYCSGTSSAMISYACPGGCASGKCNTAAPDSCADSDGGQYPSTLGTVSGNLSGSPYSLTDTCIDTTNVKEYYCSGTSSSFASYSCTYGCSGGKCNAAPPDTCSDTDGGTIYNVFGTVSGNYSGSPYSNSDVCNDATNLKEYYCSGTSSTFTTYACPNGCTSGKCNAAAPDSCADSDGGQIIYTLGTVSGNASGSPYSYTDTCSNTTSLKEYYCSGTTSTFATYACSYGCSGGKCNTAPADSCSDTDGGQTYDTYGTVSGYFGGASYSINDYCKDTNTLNESYCSGTSKTYTLYSCPSGCSGGKCNAGTADSCSDTDGGMIYDVSGTVSGYSGGSPYSYTDYCSGASNLNEYYCSGTSSTYNIYPCTYGCSGGICSAMPANSCSDTDGGIAPTTLGTVSGYYYGAYYNYTDYCSTTKRVVEYYCSGVFQTSSTSTCASSCSGGVCT